MTPEIVEKPECIIVGVRMVLEPGTAAAPKLWVEQFLPRRSELSAVDSHYYSVFNPLPGEGNGRYEFVAGVMTDSLESIPNGMVGWMLAAGNYARCQATGLSDVYRVCRAIIAEWLPDSGYRLTGNPIFAYTDGDPDAPDSVWNVHVPVESLEMLAQLETWFA